MSALKVAIYLHTDKSSQWEIGESIGLKREALRMFCHACNEVKVDLEVNEETGETKIVAVDDMLIEQRKATS